MDIEGAKQFDALAQASEIEGKLDEIGITLEQKIAALNPELLDIGQENIEAVYKIADALQEIKNELRNRLEIAANEGAYLEVVQALDELNRFLEVIGDVVTEGLKGFKVVNTIRDERIASSNLSQTIDAGDGQSPEITEVVFNFTPSKHGQQRFKINHSCIDPSSGNEMHYSFRVDYDDKRGKVLIDLETPALERAIGHIRGTDGQRGHHFGSKSLEDFANSDAFGGLVHGIREVLNEAAQGGEQESEITTNMLDALKAKFGK